MTRMITAFIREKAQKFKHAFCHRAACSRYYVKAELTFDPFSLMKGYLYLNKKPQNSSRIGIVGVHNIATQFLFDVFSHSQILFFEWLLLTDR